MSTENLNVILETTLGEEYLMGRISRVENEFHFFPNTTIQPGFNAADLRTLAAKLESLEQGTK